jgi:hypothetical protein
MEPAEREREKRRKFVRNRHVVISTVFFFRLLNDSIRPADELRKARFSIHVLHHFGVLFFSADII